MRPPESDSLLPPCGRHKWTAQKQILINQFIVTLSVIHVQTTGIIQYLCATQEKRHVEVLAYIMTQLRYFRKYPWVRKAYLYTYMYTYIFTTCWCGYI